MKNVLNIFILAALLTGFLVISPMRVEAADKAIIILDASGSMWGQIEGKPKIAIARSTIERLLNNWDPNVLLGIIAYGHRSKGDCNDIEMIVPLGKVNTASAMSSLNNINPKGKTPLSAAVKQAAEQLKYVEDKATVILVSDGEETCNADPCSLADELEKRGIDFTVHVVGFDINEEQQAKLTCLAKNTGGKFFSADNASELHKALMKTTKIIAQPKKEKKGITGVKLHAVLKQGGVPVKEDMEWWVYEAEKDINGTRKQISNTYNAEPLFKIPAGKYYVRAKHGNAITETLVEVNEGKLNEQTVNLNAGYLKTHAALKNGGEPVKEDIEWWVYEAEKDINGTRKQISNTYNAEPLFKLNSGMYYVFVKQGETYGEAEIEITPGKIEEKTVILKKK